jgi:hypothetical protein
MMQICTCEGATRKLTGTRSILWRPRMGYSFFLFAFGFWFVVLSNRVIEKREVLPLWKGTSKVVDQRIYVDWV